MRLALHVTKFGYDGGAAAIAPKLAEIGRTADEIGLDSISLMDHYFQIPGVGEPEEPMIEGYSGLCFLAAHTDRVELQLMVGGVTYRHPGLLAKIVTSLDVLSGGRAVLGLGAAWFEAEHVGLGVPFPPLKVRFEQLEETVQICRQMLDGTEGAFHGKHYQLERTLNVPAPLRRVPILIAGGGEKKTLRQVAQYADGCNLFARAGKPEPLAAKLDILRAHCADVGRNYHEISKTILFAGFTPETLVEDLKPFRDLGVDHVFVSDPGNDPAAYLRELAPAVDGVHAL